MFSRDKLMAETKLVGKIDELVQGSGNDKLDINVHAYSLITFSKIHD